MYNAFNTLHMLQRPLQVGMSFGSEKLRLGEHVLNSNIMHDTHNVVIVGAGPGGLATAMLLAQAGIKVTLLESQDRVGGRTGRLEIDGFNFDIGPTFFLYPTILEEIFRSCGRELRAEVDLRRIDPMYRLVFEGGGEMLARDTLETMAAEIARLSPADAKNLPRYMADNRAKIESFGPVLQRDFSKLSDYLAPNVLRSLALLKPHLSLDGDLRRYFSDDRVRQAFSFQAKYLGMSPFNCPSLFTILAFLEHEHGVWHPIGGCNQIMTRMAEIATEMGVDIRLNEPVTSLEFDGRRATGAVTAVGRYEADAIVMNADFADAMQRLVPDHLRKRWSNDKIGRKKFSCSTFMMYLGLDGTYEDVPHHTIVLAEDLAENIDEIQTHKVLPQAPSIYVQNASVTDPTLAPAGKSAVYVLAPVPHMTDNIDWDEAAPRFREQVLDRMALAGMADVRDRIVTEKVLTPAGWQSDFAIYKGATFNMSHTLGQMLYFRPHNRFEDLDGLYLVGGGTHPGSGLPVIFESARISSSLLCDDIGIPSPAKMPNMTTIKRREVELEKAP